MASMKYNGERHFSASLSLAEILKNPNLPPFPFSVTHLLNMQGTKRFGVSDPDTNDSAFRNKRIMPGSAFNVHRAEPSQLQPAATVSLDVQRAESSQHHVRALNAQFASWVQKQLKTHPDELWEDGVRDYLAHASSIMEKFSDIVMWLKANASRGENPSATGPFTAEKKMAPGPFIAEKKMSPGPFTAEKKMVSEIKNNETTLFHGNTGFAPVANSTSFASPWSTGAFSTSQPPVLFGIQNSVSKTRDITEDADGENEAEQPSSPSVKKSEEKGVVVVHEVKCKLYVKSSDPADKDPWKEKGMGQLSIKCKEGVNKGTKESKPTVIIRNEVGRLLLNALLYPGIKTNVQKNSLVAIFHTSGEEDGTDGGDATAVLARTFLIRLKTADDRNKLATAIQEYAPAA